MKIYKPAAMLLLLINICGAQAQEAKWTVLKTGNDAPNRSECGMAAVNGNLYIIGGDDSQALPVTCLNTKTLAFKELISPPSPMHHFQAVALGDKIYVLEAFSTGGFPNQNPMPAVCAFDTRNNSWENGAVLPAARQRAGAAAVAYNGKLYLIAGIQHGHSSGTNSMFDQYDPQSKTWTALSDAPHIRDHCSAAVIGDKLYVVGGRNTSFRDPENKITFFSQTVLDVDCYDFKSSTWSTLQAKLPLGSGGGAVVSLNNVLYYMGGERATATEANAARKDVFRLNPAKDNSWTAIDTLHYARNGMAAAVCDGKIYIAGGSGGGMPPGGARMSPGSGSQPMPPPPPASGGNRTNDKLKIEVYAPTGM